MMITLEDDGHLHIYESMADIVLAIEALDVEDTLRVIFDEQGQPYRIEWMEPNTRGWLGVRNGTYRLVANGTSSIGDLIKLITIRTSPDEHIMATLNDIVRRLQSKTDR